MNGFLEPERSGLEGVPFEVLNQERDSVSIGPGFATVGQRPSPWMLLA
jgi:hypothetical protein